MYFISGTPCGGKTTISRALARKHGLTVYDMDEHFPAHQSMAEPEHQPSMTWNFKNADEYFGRSVEEYGSWLLGNLREQFPFVLLDLIRLSQNQRVLCDCHLTVAEADRLTDVSRTAFLIREPTGLMDEYCGRPDHQDFCDFINSSTDVEKAKRTCNDTLRNINLEVYETIRNSRYFWIERTADSTVENTLSQVERHFRW